MLSTRARIRLPQAGRPSLACDPRTRSLLRDVRSPFSAPAPKPQGHPGMGMSSVRRRLYSTEGAESAPPSPPEPQGPRFDEPDDIFFESESLEADDEDRKKLGTYRPPFLLDNENRAMSWYTDFRSLSDIRFRQGQGTFLFPSAADEQAGGPDQNMVTPRPTLVSFGKKQRRGLRHLWPMKGRRLLQYWFMADNMAKFPLEPAFQEEIWDWDSKANEHNMHGEMNTWRVHRDLNLYLGNLDTRNQRLGKNLLVEKARRFYMPQEMGGFSPMVGPIIATPDEQAEKNFKGVPFLEMKDIPINAADPNQPNLWTRLQEQFNDDIFKRDWRPPATMAWDPLMNYAVPFWQEPRLRRPTGAARTWSWKHNPANEPQMRNLFYGAALMNTFDRAMAGSDRMDLPGNSRLDDPERMISGHRREMRKENAAVARYQRSILEDEYERKAEEIWSRGTISGDRGPIHYDRRPAAPFKRRWLGLMVLLFLVYLMWITGTASDKYVAEENWYQHPIVHDRARYHGFRVREMKVNGRGFWYAVADQLYGTPDVWQWVMRAFAFQFDSDAFLALSSAPIGDAQDGTTLLDFFHKTSLSDVNWVKMWVRNLPGDFDDDYRNSEWTGRPGQTMSYYDMSPDYEAMRVELNEDESDPMPKVDTKRFGGEEEEEDEEDEFDDYEESMMQMYHPMDHIDMFYAATVLNIRINLLSTCYTIPHHKAWIHIDPANGSVPRYEVNLLMHYVNGEIIGFDSLVPYDQKEWHGLAMDPEKIKKRKAKEDLPGRMAADLASSFKSYVDNRMAAIEAEEREESFNVAWESNT